MAQRISGTKRTVEKVCLVGILVLFILVSANIIPLLFGLVGAIGLVGIDSLSHLFFT